MSKSFLSYVASDMMAKVGGDLSRTAVVFPNKRASLFLNEQLVGLASRPIWSPSYTTISELFRRHSSRTVADQLKLVCDLHKSFASKTSINETIDHFYGWGQLLLADFDDIDKNLADAGMLFANLTNIHELDDNSYLTEPQRKALKRFFSNFNEGGESELKQRFLRLWQHIGDIYDDFNERLRRQQLAYEGALYREVALDDGIVFPYDHYVFVGFNFLQQVEQRLFKRLKGEGKALFYWDFDRYYMPKEHSQNDEAGYYIAQYLQDFPNELDNSDAEIYDNIGRKKDVAYISAATEHIQACYAGDWLGSGGRVKDGKRTAIVMCDETLLPSVISNIPPETGEVNITTGMPLGLSPVASLLFRLIDAQTVGYSKTSDRFSLRYVSQLLRHPFMNFVSEDSTRLCAELNSERNYHPSREELCADENLAAVFAKMTGSTEEGGQRQNPNAALLRWMMSVLRIIGTNTREAKDPLLHEAVFRAYTLLDRLATLIEAEDLHVDITTLRRLIRQLIDTTAIPFRGEPAVGVQIMGVLETRNIDFDHVLVLSCNEGKMPRGVNDASFIPYSIRKAFGLTTIDHKVAIYSYYFHRLLQRAKDVTLTYNISTENGHTGEMSRFMMQFMVESGHEVSLRQLQAGNRLAAARQEGIVKDAAVMAVLDGIESISPSAINRYLRCPLQFYYNYVAHIKEPEDTDDGEIDNRTFGNIFHKAAQTLYSELGGADGLVGKEAIEIYLKEKDKLPRIVDHAFAEELFKSRNTPKKPEYNGLQIINREVIIGYLNRLLQTDAKQAPLRILALEQRVGDDVEMETSCGRRKISVSGYIDRLDMVGREGQPPVIRVIDYKTGSPAQKSIAAVEEIFQPENIGMKHSDYYLQTFLYADIVSRSAEWNSLGLPVSPALYFIRKSSDDKYNPVLSIGGEAVADIRACTEEFVPLLKQALAEIFEPQRPFLPTGEKQRCQQCPYRQICGR